MGQELGGSELREKGTLTAGGVLGSGEYSPTLLPGPALRSSCLAGTCGWGTTLFTALFERRGPGGQGRQRGTPPGFSRSDVRTVPSPVLGPRAWRVASQPSPFLPRREPAFDPRRVRFLTFPSSRLPGGMWIRLEWNIPCAL